MNNACRLLEFNIVGIIYAINEMFLAYMNVRDFFLTVGKKNILDVLVKLLISLKALPVNVQ